MSDEAIIYSVYSRTLIEALSDRHRTKRVNKIWNKYAQGEKKFYRSNPELYNKLFAIAVECWNKNKAIYDNTIIATELMLTEMHQTYKAEYAKYFNLKETPFVKLYNGYSNQNSVELEQTTFELMGSLTNITKKELKA